LDQGNPFDLPVGESLNLTFAGVSAGPVVVSSTNDTNIVVSLYESKRSKNTGYYTGQNQMMALKWGQLANTYVIPRINSTLQDLLPFVVFAVP